MKVPRIADAIGHIDDDLITAASDNKKKTMRNRRLKWISVAACFTVLVIVSAVMLPALFGVPIISFGRYKRISFDGETLGETLSQYIDEDTEVVNTATESFSDRFSVYKISERKISYKEFQQMLKQLGIENSRYIDWHGNVINGTIKDYSSTDVEDFNMPDEELEKLAWETFNKLPFIEGTYEYCGITRTYTISSDSIGTRIFRVGVSFRRVLDGIQIRGSDQCDLYFDNTGLVEIFVKLYNYKKIGTMDMIPLESASSRIKNPDSFSIDTEDPAQGLGIVDTLQVERNELIFYNQYYLGCTILQPAYRFVGTAADADGRQAKFKSLVIAIPESYTYEEK